MNHPDLQIEDFWIGTCHPLRRNFFWKKSVTFANENSLSLSTTIFQKFKRHVSYAFTLSFCLLFSAHFLLVAAKDVFHKGFWQADDVWLLGWAAYLPGFIPLLHRVLEAAAWASFWIDSKKTSSLCSSAGWSLMAKLLVAALGTPS